MFGFLAGENIVNNSLRLCTLLLCPCSRKIAINPLIRNSDVMSQGFLFWYIICCLLFKTPIQVFFNIRVVNYLNFLFCPTSSCMTILSTSPLFPHYNLCKNMSQKRCAMSYVQYGKELYTVRCGSVQTWPLALCLSLMNNCNLKENTHIVEL